MAKNKIKKAFICLLCFTLIPVAKMSALQVDNHSQSNLPERSGSDYNPKFVTQLAKTTIIGAPCILAGIGGAVIAHNGFNKGNYKQAFTGLTLSFASVGIFGWASTNIWQESNQ